MPPTLPDQLRRIKSRVRQLLCLYGASWLVVVVFGATLAVGFLDWLVHLDDPGVRLILGLTILGGGLWVAWRRLIAPLLTVRRYSDIDVAKQVERRYPGFRDSLASTVQFLKDDASPQIGSPALQRHVIDSTLRQASRIDASDVVETRGVRRVALAATIVCLVTALVVGLNQVAAATALGRLLSPFSHRPWPRTTELVLFDAKFEPLGRHLRVARGESLEIVIENARGPLPRDLAMEYRYGESEQARERLRRTTRRDAGGRSREIGVATFVADRGPIRFRAIGGDDDEMPWHVLEVVPPPELESLQATLTPPAYAGAQPERLPAGVGHVQGLVGTRVEIAGVAGKPLGSAVLRVKDDPPVAVGPGPGRELKASFVIRDAGVYSWWLDLEDRQGFANPDAPRYEIRGIADQIPQVSIEEPASSMLVTPDAEIPLRISARDDLGLKLVRLVYRIGDSPDIAASGRVLAEPSERPLELLVSESWRLAELSLGPGVSVVFHAEAVDWFDLGPEHVGRSIPRTLTIVAPEEKRAELADRHGGLLDELEEALQSERRVWEQTGELIEQLDIVGRLRPQDIDLLKRVELDQRQVASRLHNPAGGVAARAERLQQELQANRIDDADMARRLKQLLEELQILRDEHLPPIDRELTRARKGAQPELQRESSAPGADASGSQEEAPAARDARAQSEALAAARDHQDAVVRSLEDLVEQMNRWRSRQK
ncbi:MAG: hypothetical protein KY476_15485, partial [Planctomycetes bacterium]|nr:hypothetical protein [Planctomycetota bacterium]